MEAQLEMHRVVPVNEASQVGQVRRDLQQFANAMSALEDVGARAALVATELSTNLLKHSADGGEILFRALAEEGQRATGLEILSLDRGKGIPNISRAFTDGFSTAGSPGTGLGAIQRMSDAMEIYSAAKHGTVISTQIWPRGPSAKVIPPRVRAICAPLKGFNISGDYSIVVTKGAKVHFMVADGLGHGEEAAEPSHRAAAIFRQNITCELTEIMERIHDGLKGTRGAAIALASFDSSHRTLKYVAVGNIDSRFCTEEGSHGCATLNGTAGVQMPRLTQFEYQVPPAAVIVMHSDGLSSRWNLRAYPGLRLQSPGLIAGLLYRDFARKRDDATILAYPT